MTNRRLSSRIIDLEPSPIREILSIIDAPGMVSFAGGLPAAQTFPDLTVAGVPRGCLQYGPSEGDATLRAYIAQDLAAIGLHCSPDQILILSGSQQGIDLVAKLFVDSGTPLAVESPTYLAALQAFRFFGARFVPFHTSSVDKSWATNSPALVYTIPTFQNPTGRCYSADERDALAQACDKHAVPLFEDDPYRDLAYDACERSPICGRLRRASWIYQGSFSKTLAPGLRLGFLVSSPDLTVYLTRLKQAADLHSNRVSQWLVLEQLRSAGRTARLQAVVSLYRRKRDYFGEALQRHLASVATWEVPPGGLFYWLRLRQVRDTRELLSEALRRGVAFMPGEPFYPENPTRCGSLRLNFSHADEAATERGSPLWRSYWANAASSVRWFCVVRHSLIRRHPLKRGMESNIVALQGCVPGFRAKLDSLADMADTLYALFRLAETQPESFDAYRQLAMSQTGEGGLRLKFVLKAWPGRATADALRSGAETLLAELKHYPLADGAVLCASTLLDNLRIVGGLYVTANQRDPASFLRCADQRVVDHWLNAVCESQVEYPEVLDSLQNCAVPKVYAALSRDAPSRAVPD